MDLCFLSSVLSIMYSCILHTADALPTAEAPTASAASAASAAAAQEHHVRTKRCSCATFLDKECVYFCHLDIIWVNTPERVVSYGLGSAPRTKRAAAESMATSSGARCQCSRREDSTCGRFCRLRTSLASKVSSRISEMIQLLLPSQACASRGAAAQQGPGCGKASPNRGHLQS